MSITELSTTQTISNNSTQGVKSELLDPELFLKLLVTQMQNQDPFNSDNDPTAQISQLATFSMIEQLSQLNDSFNQSQQLMLMNQGAELIGREVTVETDETTVTGQVDLVRVVEGTPLVLIGEEAYPVNQVIEIRGE